MEPPPGGEVSKATTSEVERLFLQMMITGRSDVVPLPSAVDNMIVTISRTVGAMRDDGVRCELAGWSIGGRVSGRCRGWKRANVWMRRSGSCGLPG